MAAERRIVIYCSQTPGSTPFFDISSGTFIDGETARELLKGDHCELEMTDLPYTIELDLTNMQFFDTVRSISITEAEAKQLTNSGGATLRITRTSNHRQGNEQGNGRKEDNENPSPDADNAKDQNGDDDRTEKLLIGATAASGTTAVAAGAASVPFLAGFTANGVAAGSVAAGIQSGIGSVAAGSWFATMQSIAATTLIGTAAPVVAACAAAGGTVACGYALHKHYQRRGDQEIHKDN